MGHPPEVEKYKVIGDYLIVRQRLNGLWPQVEYGMDSPSIYKHGQNNTYYWIYNRKDKSLNGAYIYSEFIDECNRLGIEIF